jgi:C1A family cysteine protease
MESPLTKLLKEQKLTIVPIDNKVYTSNKFKYPNQPIFTHLVIPPNRADIEFSKNSKYFKTIPKNFRASKVSLPEYWANYDPNVSKYAAIVTKPQNQQKCGSCFAFAVATAMNDVFIFGDDLDFNPDISPLSVLSCLTDNPDCNAQCGGGNPICILHQVEKQGLTTNHCMNYDKFCDNDTNCYTPAKKAFDEKTKIFKEDAPIVDSNIPSCGCCPSCDNFSYYIKDVTLISINGGLNIDPHPDAVQLVKEHLLNRGSAVSGFIVYSNFVHDISNGKFEKTNGVYIETENYSSDPNANPKEFMGCHAIVVVGWGIEKSDIKLDDGSILKNTPYWIVRNSWTANWGLNGYFKIAMSQVQNGKKINQDTALGTINDVLIGNQKAEMGGIIIFEPSDIKPYKNKREKCLGKQSCDEKSPLSKHTSPPSPTSPTRHNNNNNYNLLDKDQNETQYILYMIYVIIFLLIVLFVISRLRK